MEASLAQLLNLPSVQFVLDLIFEDEKATCTDLTMLTTLNHSLFISTGCFSLLLAKTTSIALIFASFILKLPTLLNVYNNKTVTGIAVAAVYGDCIMYSNAAFYGVLMGYPFEAWGDTLIQLIGAVIMVSMFWTFSSYKLSQTILPILTYLTYLVLVFVILPSQYYYLLPRLNWPMVIFTRGSQILEFNRVKHTGSLSGFTMFMQAFGSFVRIFTTVKLVGLDLSMVVGYVLGFSLNGCLFSMWVYYRENTRVFLEGLKKEEKKEKKSAPDSPSMRTRSSLQASKKEL